MQLNQEIKPTTFLEVVLLLYWVYGWLILNLLTGCEECKVFLAIPTFLSSKIIKHRYENTVRH